MADFTQEERCLLSSVLPNLATALRTPLNNLHLAAERMASRGAPAGDARLQICPVGVGLFYD